jgi:hypothetical protein
MELSEPPEQNDLIGPKEADSAFPVQSTSNRMASTTQEQIDFLKIEIEHFYKAEIQSEQRASWLLTIAVVGLGLLLNSFLSGSDRRLNGGTPQLLTACTVFLFCAVALALLAIWPLRGRRGVLQSPFNRNRPSRPLVPQSGPALDTWTQQYTAHRVRATKKAVRVVWTLLFLGLGVAAGALAVLKNAGS